MEKNTNKQVDEGKIGEFTAFKKHFLIFLKKELTGNHLKINLHAFYLINHLRVKILKNSGSFMMSDRKM